MDYVDDVAPLVFLNLGISIVLINMCKPDLTSTKINHSVLESNFKYKPAQNCAPDNIL